MLYLIFSTSAWGPMSSTDILVHIQSYQGDQRIQQLEFEALIRKIEMVPRRQCGPENYGGTGNQSR